MESQESRPISYDPLKSIYFKKDFDPNAVIVEYVNAFGSSKSDRKIFASRRDFNVSMVETDADLSEVSKKALLIASKLLITHNFLQHCTPVGLDFDYDMEDWPTHPDAADNYYISCPSVERLAKWIVDVAPLIRSGQVVYFPKISRIIDDWGNDPYYRKNEDIFSQKDTIDIVLRCGKVVELRGDATLGSRLVVPLLSVDLPHIEGTSLHDFARIVTEETDSYDAARDFLRRRLLDLETCNTREELISKRAKLSIEVAEGLREVRSELKLLARRRAVQAAGGVAATSVAILAAIEGTALQELISVIGAAGGGWSIISALQQHEVKIGLKTQPFYFFWLLQNKIRTA